MLKMYDWLLKEILALEKWVTQKRIIVIRKKIALKDKEYTLLLDTADKVLKERKELEAKL